MSQSFPPPQTAPSATPSVDSPGPSPLGRRAFLFGAAGAAGALVGATMLSSTVAAVELGASYFEALAPDRFCDTRPQGGFPAGFGYERLDGNTIRVRVAGSRSAPGDAVAAALTVTGVSYGTNNFLTVFPSGEGNPGTSNVNFNPTDTAVANLVTVKLGAGGSVDIYSPQRCDVIVDVAGVYRPTSVPVAAGRFQALDVAVRALDTRSQPGKPAPGSVVTVILNGIVPANAVAVVANVTAVGADDSGYVSAYPLGAPVPATSSLNVAAGETRAVGVITKLGSLPGVIGFSLFTLKSAHLIVDVAGYITGAGSAVSSAGLFVPITPVRLLDTRTDSRRLWPGWTRSFTLPAPINTRAQAIAANLTVTRTGAAGYFTLYPAQTDTGGVSSLNVNGPGQTIANHAICRVSGAGVACYAYESGHVICDVTGWFTGTPAAPYRAVPVDPPPPPAQLPYIVSVPRMGLGKWVYDGDSAAVVDSGQVWHWSGTGLVGQGSNTVMFGHRTSAGGPFRPLNEVQGGDELYVLTPDGRRYTYQSRAAYITSKYPSDILTTARNLPGDTVSLVACSKPNGQPTSLSYRLVVTFVLVGWVDLG